MSILSTDCHSIKTLQPVWPTTRSGALLDQRLSVRGYPTLTAEYETEETLTAEPPTKDERKAKKTEEQHSARNLHCER